MGKTSLIFLIVVVNSFFSVTCESYFYYFAYGSNLLQKRLKILNPSAEFFGTAKLQDYRLDFIKYAPTWRGAVATIVEDPGSEVWGAVWLIKESDRENLDRRCGARGAGKGRGATTRIALMGVLRIPGAMRAHDGRDAGSLHAGGALPETIPQ
ncbi:Gamma-glutamylcyclotransferase [Eumeta japonica]|uniref:gamma-glutamylcyclotransferase n=1 Tax=Eumeta variegata TaxID=151549 RepID=A0A4C1VID8_EUMVA|nr:Gamma-glutamylcyclotransferase [Eumeta japonica]